MKIIFLIMMGFILVQAEFLRDDTKEVVLDTTTLLMWQDDNETKEDIYKKAWSDAIVYCEAKTLGGYNDWRLPNINELASLSDKSISRPALSSIFQNIYVSPPNYSDGSYYWSSTTGKYNGASGGWSVEFDSGGSGRLVKSYSHHIRCVRTSDN